MRGRLVMVCGWWLVGLHATVISTRLAVDSKPVSVHASDICILNSCNF